MNPKIRIPVITTPRIIPPTNEAGSNPLSAGRAAVVCITGAFVGVSVVVLGAFDGVKLVGDVVGVVVEFILGVVCVVALGLMGNAAVTVVLIASAEKNISIICRFIYQFIYSIAYHTF